MASYPTTSLEPGSTNTQAVKQLQDYLVSQGYMTQAQVNTGYGTYGNQTKNAVVKLQSDKGVDTAGYPGYWGPRTIGGLQNTQSQNQTPYIPPQNQTPYVQNQTPYAPQDRPINQQSGQAYTVQSGDSISSIASRLGVPASSISGYRSGNPNIIYPGEQLTIGTAVSPDPVIPPEDVSPEIAPPSEESGSFLDELISLNPFIQEQLQDPTLKAQFDSLPEELKPSYYQLLDQLGKSIEAGKVVNPDIEISPEKLKEFLDKATTELDPYYQEQIGFVKKDLETSMSRLQEDFEREVGRAEEPFRERLSEQAEAEAQAGTTFGSERAVRERKLVLTQQQAIDDALRGSARSAQDIASQAERQIGTTALSASPLLPQYQVGTKGFTEGDRRLAFTPQGNIMGDISKSREVGIKSRASELEEIERRQRALDLNKLS